MQRRSRADWATVARERGDLAAVVAARRKELGLTQVALGDLAGVSYRVVHNLEAGRVEVSLERLLAVLQTLGLHVAVERGTRQGVVAGHSLGDHYGLEAGEGSSGHPPDGGASGREERP